MAISVAAIIFYSLGFVLPALNILPSTLIYSWTYYQKKNIRSSSTKILTNDSKYNK